MNRHIFGLKITVLLLTLLCNGVSFGMKRSFDKISTSVVTEEISKNAQQKLTLDDYCNQSLDYCIQPISIKSYKKSLSVERHQKFNNFSAEDKIRCLEEIDQSRRENIDKTQSSRYITFCSLSEKDAKQIIANDFKKMKKQIHNNEIIGENAFIDSFGIDVQSQEWKDAMRELHAREQFNIASMKQINKHTKWNCNLPVNVAIKLADVMQEKGFEPTAFYVRCYDNKSKNVASFFEPMPILEPKEYKVSAPGCFYFNEKLATANEAKVSFIINHEITHVLENHSTRRNSLVNIIARIKKIDCKAAILPTCEYAQYILAQETVADTMMALENPKIARASQGLTFYPNSYGILKTINTHLDVLEHFDKKRSDSMTITENKFKNS